MIDKKRNDENRAKLVLRANSTEVKERLKESPTDPELWYQLGMALNEEQGEDASIEALSQGLVYNPFSAQLYFGRGRRFIKKRCYWHCIADMTMAIRLQPEVWNYFYYRAVAENLNGQTEDAIADFMECFKQTEPCEQYPLVDWLFLCCLDQNNRERAKEMLDLIDANIIPPAMDYAYRRRVQLYKGIVTPEEFIDVEHIKSHCLQLPNRVQLEIETLTFGLFVYYNYIDDQEKANETLLKIASFKPSAAFGYLKGTAIARERGLID